MTSPVIDSASPEVPLHRNTNFCLLVAGHGTSLVGNATVPIGATFAALHLSGGSVSVVAGVLAAETVPMVVLVLFGGVLADRINRRFVMIGSDLLRLGSALCVGVALVAGMGGIGLLVTMMVLYGVGAAFFHPALAGLIPLTVRTGNATDKSQLQRADGVLMATSGTSWVIGPAIAGGLVAVAGPGAVFLFDAATFAVSVVCVALIRVRSRDNRTEAHTLWRDLTEGWKEFSSRSWVWLTIASVAAMFAFVIAPLNALGPVVAEARLGGATSWAIIVAALSIGRVGGGVLAMVWMPARPLLVGSAMVLLQAPAMLALALDSPLWLLAVAQAAGGVGVGFFLSVWGFVLQSWIPSDKLSRVNSYDWFGTLLAMPIGYLLVATTASQFGTRPVLLGAMVFVFVAVIPLLLTKSVRNLGRAPKISEALL